MNYKDMAMNLYERDQFYIKDMNGFDLAIDEVAEMLDKAGIPLRNEFNGTDEEYIEMYQNSINNITNAVDGKY